MSAVNDLHLRLDALWAEYLDLLDTYANGQEQIQKHFAAGFFSLARANATSSIGRRHGSDWYDDRTRASARVNIEPQRPAVEGEQTGPPPLGTTFRIFEQAQYVLVDRQSISKSSGAPSDPLQQPTPSGTPITERSDVDEAAEKPCATKKLQKDPLSWFGLLPSPSMRTAQSSFKAMVHNHISESEVVEKADEQDTQSPLAAIANAARAMRAIELEVRKLRKTIRQAERAAQPQKSVA